MLDGKLTHSAFRNSYPCLILGLQGLYKLSAMLMPCRLILLACMDADAFEVNPKMSFTYSHSLGLLGIDKLGTCQSKSMGHPYLQLPKKGLFLLAEE